MGCTFPPRYLWLLFYVALNAAYCVAIAVTGRLFGESAMVPLLPNTPVALIGTLVCLSYVLITGPAFEGLKRVTVIGAQQIASLPWERTLGPALLLLQLLFMCYFLLTGTYVAGSNVRDPSLLSAIWVLVPVDMLVLIFYAIRGQGSWAKANICIWVFSALIRGWTGALLTLIFIESSRAIRKGKLRLKPTLAAILVIALLYPPLYYAKLYYRFAGSEGLVSFVTNLDKTNVISTFEEVEASDAIIHSFQRVLDRLQITSSAIVAFQNSTELENAIEAIRILPPWLEGIHGLALYRLLGEPAPTDMGQAMAQHIDPQSFETNWNSNPTFVGYIFANPFARSLLIVIYSVALGLASMILMRLLKWNENTIDVLWYAWLVYLVPGWLGAFFLFVYSLLLLVIIKTLLQLISRARAVDAPC